MYRMESSTRRDLQKKTPRRWLFVLETQRKWSSTLERGCDDKSRVKTILDGKQFRSSRCSTSANKTQNRFDQSSSNILSSCCSSPTCSIEPLTTSLSLLEMPKQFICIHEVQEGQGLKDLDKSNHTHRVTGIDAEILTQKWKAKR